MGWQRPSTDEPALARLIADTEEQIRFKLNSVNRLRNTILYAEKVRQEWELKANELLAHSRAQESQQRAPPWAESNSPFDSPALQPLPNDEASPRLIEGLDLPRPSQGLRRQSSHLFGLTSPNLSPSDGLPSSLGSPPTGPSLLSPRIPSGVPSSRTKASSIKDFKILKPISKGACEFGLGAFALSHISDRLLPQSQQSDPSTSPRRSLPAITTPSRRSRSRTWSPRTRSRTSRPSG